MRVDRLCGRIHTEISMPTLIPTPTQAPKRVVGYYTAWSVYGRKFPVQAIPVDLLTHVNYAFANLKNGECVLGDIAADQGNFAELRTLKQAHPQLRTLISVGGWTWSHDFSDVALTAESRQHFAQACVAFMHAHGFDGIDIDWEYPVSGGSRSNITRPEDKQNFTLLLAALRRALDAQGASDGQSYLLTIAAPAGTSIMANLELDKIHPLIDWLNLMAYDFNGSWSDKTGFNAPLYAPTDDPQLAEHPEDNVDAAVQAYLAAGVPPAKLVLGMPFYGRAWGKTVGGDRGLYASWTYLPPGQWEKGVFEYGEIATKVLQDSSYTRHWHKSAQVPWLYRPEHGFIISYDDPESIAAKADYVLQHELGGAMVWELSADRVAEQHPLLAVLAERLLPQPAATPNAPEQP
jgi:chitinase